MKEELKRIPKCKVILVLGGDSAENALPRLKCHLHALGYHVLEMDEVKEKEGEFTVDRSVWWI